MDSWTEKKKREEKERQEKDQLEAEMTRAEEITSSVGRWRQDGTRIADGIDAWQKPLFVYLLVIVISDC